MGESLLRVFVRFRAFSLPLAAVFVAFIAMPVNAGQATLPGIDVSHHNGHPNWAQVKADGIKFVIAKVTEGTTFQDPYYLENKQEVEALGMAFTGYHFAQPDTAAGSAVAQADFFVASAQLTGKDLVPVLDLEVSNGLGARKLKQWAKDWLSEVHAKLGVKATIYTTASFWQSSLGNTHWFADNGYRLWIAHWTDAAQPTMPASNWGGKSWTLWQYDNMGTVAGVDGAVDLDRYAGTSLGPLKIKNNR
jgi:GH25 family lysozyme M1 (1,4-beta-N-acetylmuramidase)